MTKLTLVIIGCKLKFELVNKQTDILNIVCVYGHMIYACTLSIDRIKASLKTEQI